MEKSGSFYKRKQLVALVNAVLASASLASSQHVQYIPKTSFFDTLQQKCDGVVESIIRDAIRLRKNEKELTHDDIWSTLSELDEYKFLFDACSDLLMMQPKPIQFRSSSAAPVSSRSKPATGPMIQDDISAPVAERDDRIALKSCFLVEADKDYSVEDEPATISLHSAFLRK